MQQVIVRQQHLDTALQQNGSPETIRLTRSQRDQWSRTFCGPRLERFQTTRPCNRCDLRVGNGAHDLRLRIPPLREGRHDRAADVSSRHRQLLHLKLETVSRSPSELQHKGVLELSRARQVALRDRQRLAILNCRLNTSRIDDRDTRLAWSAQKESIAARRKSGKIRSRKRHNPSEGCVSWLA